MQWIEKILDFYTFWRICEWCISDNVEHGVVYAWILRNTRAKPVMSDLSSETVQCDRAQFQMSPDHIKLNLNQRCRGRGDVINRCIDPELWLQINMLWMKEWWDRPPYGTNLNNISSDWYDFWNYKQLNAEEHHVNHVWPEVTRPSASVTIATQVSAVRPG